MTIYFYYSQRDWLVVPVDAVIIFCLVILLLSRLLYLNWLSLMAGGVLFAVMLLEDWAAAETGSVAAILWTTIPVAALIVIAAVLLLRRRGRHSGKDRAPEDLT